MSDTQTSKKVDPFRVAYYTDVTVNRMVQQGYSFQEIIVALSQEKAALVKRVVALDSIAPKKYERDGKVFVWHCPDALIPIEGELR